MAAVASKKVATWITFGKEMYSKFIVLIHARDFLAECLATFMLVTLGNGAVAQFVFSHGTATFFSVNAGYGIGLMVGVYLAGGVTGGHMNPAITLAMALRGKTKWIKVIPYWIAQLLGAFIGSAVVYGAYVDLINNYNGSLPTGELNPNCLTNGTVTPKLPLCTGGIFATYPNAILEIGTGILNEIVGTFLLTLGVIAIVEADQSEVILLGLKPFMIGLAFWGVVTSFGISTGAVNPARDLGPRIFTALAGWGKDVFVCSQCSIAHYWLIPVTAPFLGAAIAAGVYWFMVEANHPTKKEVIPTGKKEIIPASKKDGHNKLKRTDTTTELVETEI